MSPGEPPPLDAESLLRQSAWLAGLARALVARDDEVDDVVQQTWVRALEKPPADRRNLRGWLGAVARNVVRMRARSDTARVARESRWPSPAPVERPEEAVARAELRRAVVDAVLALTEPTRTALILRFFEEQPVAVVAALTQSEEEAVRSRLKRGLAQVRARLQETSGASGAWLLQLQQLAGEVVARKAVAAGAAGGATAAGLGGLAMTSTAKGIAGAAVLVAAVAASWWCVRDPADRRAAREGAALAASAAGVGVAAEPAATAPIAPPPAVPAVATRVDEPPASAPPPREPQEVRGTVRGRVVDAEGHGVAGATVFAIAGGSRGVSVDGVTALATNLDPSTPTTTSGSDGAFELAGLRLETDWDVAAHEPTLGSAVAHASPFDASRTVVDVTLTLVPQVKITVRTLASDGTLLGGIGVMIQRRSAPNSTSASFVETAASGPERGTAVTALHAIEAIEVMATASGFKRTEKPQRVAIPRGARQVAVDLVLEPVDGIDAVGPIVDERGAPLDLRAFVAARTQVVAGFDVARRFELFVFAATDAPPVLDALLEKLAPAGAVRDADPPGRGVVWHARVAADFRGLVALTFDRRVVAIARVDDPSRPPPLPVVAALFPPPRQTATLVVTCVDGVGAPLDVSTVDLLVTPFAPQSQGLRNPDSRPGAAANVREFTIPLGRVVATGLRRGSLATAPEIECAVAGERREVTVRFARADAMLRGRLLGPDGAPVVGASLQLYRFVDAMPEEVPVDRIETDRAGRFEVRGLVEDDYLVINNGWPGSPAIAKGRATVAGTDVELRQQAATTVTLKVVYPATLRERHEVSWRIVDDEEMPVVNGIGPTFQRSVDGERVTARLANGHYRLFLWARGCREATAEFDVPEDATGVEVPLEVAR